MTDGELLEEIKTLKCEIAELKEAGKEKKTRNGILLKGGVLAGIILAFLVSSLVLYAATITKPHTFTDATVISAADVNENFDTLYTESNSQHNRITVLEAKKHFENVNVGFLICWSGIFLGYGSGWDGEGAIGEIRMITRNTSLPPPDGWLYCQGQTLQIMNYTALFSLIGTTYGGNGTTTFALPDLRGKVAVQPQ